MDARFASRKFIIAAFALLAATALLIAGKIDQATWSSFCTWVIGLYVTGNLGAAVVAKVAAAPEGGGYVTSAAGVAREAK